MNHADLADHRARTLPTLAQLGVETFPPDNALYTMGKQ